MEDLANNMDPFPPGPFFRGSGFQYVTHTHENKILVGANEEPDPSERLCGQDLSPSTEGVRVPPYYRSDLSRNTSPTTVHVSAGRSRRRETEDPRGRGPTLTPCLLPRSISAKRTLRVGVGTPVKRGSRTFGVTVQPRPSVPSATPPTLGPDVQSSGSSSTRENHHPKRLGSKKCTFTFYPTSVHKTVTDPRQNPEVTVGHVPLDTFRLPSPLPGRDSEFRPRSLRLQRT